MTKKIGSAAEFFWTRRKFFCRREFFCWGYQEKVLGSSNFFCAAQKKSSTRRTFSAHPTKIFAWAEKIGDTLAKFPSDPGRVPKFCSSRGFFLRTLEIFLRSAPIFSESGEKKSELRARWPDFFGAGGEKIRAAPQNFGPGGGSARGTRRGRDLARSGRDFWAPKIDPDRPDRRPCPSRRGTGAEPADSGRIRRILAPQNPPRSGQIGDPERPVRDPSPNPPISCRSRAKKAPFFWPDRAGNRGLADIPRREGKKSALFLPSRADPNLRTESVVGATSVFNR